MQHQQHNTELEPLIGGGNCNNSNSDNVSMCNSRSSYAENNLQLDKLPSYNESMGHHLLISVNIPTPPSYQESMQLTGQQIQQQTHQGYPAMHILVFGVCMLIGAGILYAFKHGL